MAGREVPTLHSKSEQDASDRTFKQRATGAEVFGVSKRSRAALMGGALVAVLVLGGSVVRAAAGPSARHEAAATQHPPTPSHPTWHFEGQHHGIEQFQSKTRLCPVLDHRLSEL